MDVNVVHFQPHAVQEAHIPTTTLQEMSHNRETIDFQKIVLTQILYKVQLSGEVNDRVACHCAEREHRMSSWDNVSGLFLSILWGGGNDGWCSVS